MGRNQGISEKINILIKPISKKRSFIWMGKYRGGERHFIDVSEPTFYLGEYYLVFTNPYLKKSLYFVLSTPFIPKI